LIEVESDEKKLEAILSGLLTDPLVVLKKAIENIKEAGLQVTKSDKKDIDQELMGRVLNFEQMLECKKKTADFDVTFKVANLTSETESKSGRIRVATLQIDIPNYVGDTVPYVFAPEIAKEYGTKLLSMIGLSVEKNSDYRVDFLCFPEMSLPAWISEKVLNLINDSSPYVIAGFEYEGLRNVCKIFCSGRVFSQYKTSRSKFEDSAYDENRMETGNYIQIFKTKKGNFAVLICNEYMDARRMYLDMIPAKLQALFPKECLNVLFVLSQNPKPEEFAKWALGDCDRLGIHIILCNSAKYGGSSIISPQPATDGKTPISMAKGEQNVLCCELDIGSAQRVNPIANTKNGQYFTRVVDLPLISASVKKT
jgi:hypothetical protein